MARTTREETVPTAVGYRGSPYASFMLTLIVLLLAAILVLMIIFAVKSRNASHTVSGKVDNLTGQLQQINNSLSRLTKP